MDMKKKPAMVIMIYYDKKITGVQLLRHLIPPDSWKNISASPAPVHNHPDYTLPTHN